MISPALKPATTYRAIVGRVLMELRMQADMTQAELAASIGVTQSAWSRIESGSNALAVDQMRRAASSLGVPPNEILAYAERIEASLRQQGVRVESAPPEAALGRGVVLIGAPALSAAVGTVIVGDGTRT